MHFREFVEVFRSTRSKVRCFRVFQVVFTNRLLQIVYRVFGVALRVLVHCCM